AWNAPALIDFQNSWVVPFGMTATVNDSAAASGRTVSPSAASDLKSPGNCIFRERREPRGNLASLFAPAMAVRGGECRESAAEMRRAGALRLRGGRVGAVGGVVLRRGG